MRTSECGVMHIAHVPKQIPPATYITIGREAIRVEKQLQDELMEQIKHCNGVDCGCEAYGECECACEADWRSPDEVVMQWMREHPSTRYEVLDIFLGTVQ